MQFCWKNFWKYLWNTQSIRTCIILEPPSPAGTGEKKDNFKTLLSLLLLHPLSYDIWDNLFRAEKGLNFPFQSVEKLVGFIHTNREREGSKREYIAISLFYLLCNLCRKAAMDRDMILCDIYTLEEGPSSFIQLRYRIYILAQHSLTFVIVFYNLISNIRQFQMSMKYDGKPSFLTLIIPWFILLRIFFSSSHPNINPWNIFGLLNISACLVVDSPDLHAPKMVHSQVQVDRKLVDRPFERMACS